MKVKKILYFIITILVLSSCAQDEKENNIGGITGSVIDQTTNEPISAAEVTLTPSGITTVTTDDGIYDFTDIEAKTYTLTVTKEFYTSATKEVAVISGRTVKSDVKLERLPSQLSVEPKNIDFGSNSSNTSQSFRLVNKGKKEMKWTIKYDDCSWISAVIPSSGTLSAAGTQQITLTIDRKKLAKGNNEYHLSVSAQSSGGASIKMVATNDREIPSLVTVAVGNVKATTVTFNGKIIEIGNPTYTERGFVYAKTPQPTKENCIKKITCDVSTTLGFSKDVTDLNANTIYYVQAYATNAEGTAYGGDEIFTTESISAKLTTSAVSNINATSAIFNASITEIGSPAYTERGFCYGKSNNPTIADNKKIVAGSGAGEFSYNGNGLEYQTTYYVRAYVIQNGITIYGNSVSFSTVWKNPSLTTSAVTNVNASSATFNASIMEAGVPAYSERGFVYGTTNIPTVNNNRIKVSGVGITGNYKYNITGLNSGVTYYVRAYVVQNGEIIYGDIVSFTTINLPIVQTNPISNLTPISTIGIILSWNVTLNGNVISSGSPAYIERGFVYNTSDNPTVSSNKKVVSGSGTGTFYANITGLQNYQTYYVRAYVKTSLGTYIYGQSESFQTYDW